MNIHLRKFSKILIVNFWGLHFVECSLSSNDSAKILQFPDTTKFQRVIRRDFQHAFNPKPVKCYSSH